MIAGPYHPRHQPSRSVPREVVPSSHGMEGTSQKATKHPSDHQPTHLPSPSLWPRRDAMTSRGTATLLPLRRRTTTNPHRWGFPKDACNAQLFPAEPTSYAEVCLAGPHRSPIGGPSPGVLAPCGLFYSLAATVSRSPFRRILPTTPHDMPAPSPPILPLPRPGPHPRVSVFSRPSVPPVSVDSNSTTRRAWGLGWSLARLRKAWPGHR